MTVSRGSMVEALQRRCVAALFMSEEKTHVMINDALEKYRSTDLSPPCRNDMSEMFTGTHNRTAHCVLIKRSNLKATPSADLYEKLYRNI